MRLGALLRGALAAVAAITIGAPAAAGPLSLAEVAERVRSRGPAATLGAADVRVAAALRAAAPLPPITNPSIEIVVDRGSATKDAAVQSELHVPFEVTGQRGARIEEADANLRWRKAEAQRLVAGALGEAVSAYGELAVATARLRDAEEGERAARDEAGYQRARFQASDATSVDVALADAEHGRWLQARSEAEIAVVRARSRLAVALGEERLEAEPAAENVPALAAATEAALAARVTDAAPIVDAPAQEASFWAAARERLVADRTPPVSVVLLAGRGDLGEARFGGGLAWQLPVTRRAQAEIARAEGERDRALVARGVARRAVSAAARGNAAALAKAREALATHDRVAIPAASALVASARAALAAGKTDLGRVLYARRDLAAARARRLDTLALAWSAYAELAGLLGDLP
jgi:cobalt-zinc-cadmium efflux system outer membrane protein